MSILIYLLILVHSEIYKCIEYDDADNCIKCSEGYGIDTDLESKTYGKCIICIDYKCGICSENAYTCTFCSGYEYGIDNDENSPTYQKCIRCKDPNCRKCSYDYKSCLNCSEYFQIDNTPNSKTYGKCVYCEENCDICDGLNQGECEYCTVGYTLNDEKKCISLNIEICQDGYGYDDNMKCIKCQIENCQSCYYAKYCSKCEGESSYYDTQQEKCLNCNDAIPSCVSCEYDSYYEKTKCTKCPKGFKLIDNECHDQSLCNKDKHCTLCINGTCTECEFGYGYNSSNQCVPCNTDNCIDCSSANTCKKCKEGYGPDSFYNLCKPCEDINCAYCILGICQYCKEGYARDISTFSYPCVKNTIPHCLLYDGEDYCSHCDTGFYFDESHNCVDRCDPNCKCTKYTCDDCQEGFKKSEDNKCIPKCKPENCLECDHDTSICDRCKNGYMVDYSRDSDNYGKCLPCSVENCQICDRFKDICLNCLDGYNRKNNKCELIPSDDDNNDDESNDDESNDDENDGNDNSGDNNEKGNSSKKKLPLGAIIGIAVGGVIVVGLVIFLLVYFLVIKKNKVGASSSN